MGLFGNNIELQFGTRFGEPHAWPLKQRKGKYFYRGERKVGRTIIITRVLPVVLHHGGREWELPLQALPIHFNWGFCWLICFHCSLKGFSAPPPRSTLAVFAEYNHSLMSEALPMYKLLGVDERCPIPSWHPAWVRGWDRAVRDGQTNLFLHNLD